MELRLWISLQEVSVLRLSSLLLMPIDTQSFVSSTKRQPIESLVNRDRPSSSLMMTSNLTILDNSKSLFMRVSTMLQDSSSVSPRSLKDSDRDLLSTLESRLDQLPDTSSSTMVLLISTLFLIYPKRDWSSLFRTLRITNLRSISSLLQSQPLTMSQSKLSLERPSRLSSSLLTSMSYSRPMPHGAVIVRNSSQCIPSSPRSSSPTQTSSLPRWMPLRMNTHWCQSLDSPPSDYSSQMTIPQLTIKVTDHSTI